MYTHFQLLISGLFVLFIATSIFLTFGLKIKGALAFIIAFVLVAILNIAILLSNDHRAEKALDAELKLFFVQSNINRNLSINRIPSVNPSYSENAYKFYAKSSDELNKLPVSVKYQLSKISCSSIGESIEKVAPLQLAIDLLEKGLNCAWISYPDMTSIKDSRCQEISENMYLLGKAYLIKDYLSVNNNRSISAIVSIFNLSVDLMRCGDYQRNQFGLKLIDYALKYLYFLWKNGELTEKDKKVLNGKFESSTIYNVRSEHIASIAIRKAISSAVTDVQRLSWLPNVSNYQTRFDRVQSLINEINIISEWKYLPFQSMPEMINRYKCMRDNLDKPSIIKSQLTLRMIKTTGIIKLILNNNYINALNTSIRVNATYDNPDIFSASMLLSIYDDQIEVNLIDINNETLLIPDVSLFSLD